MFYCVTILSFEKKFCYHQITLHRVQAELHALQLLMIWINNVLVFLQHHSFTEVVVAPPAIYLDYTRAILGTRLGVAGQNCYTKASGDFTGENRYFHLTVPVNYFINAYA